MTLLETLPPAHRTATHPPPATGAGLGPRLVATLLIVGPLAALGLGVPLLWGRAIHLRDIIVAVILYAITGHGVTVGFHRLFTHGSFKPKRPLKIALAVAGSMAVEGSIVSWVANHRRHHMFSDKAGDPHSPNLGGSSLLAQLKGFAHAHIGWFFLSDPTSAERFAPDLLADTDITTVNRMFPALTVVSLTLPFALGWLLSGTLIGALTCLLWGGLARMVLLHHVTWSVNSVCHMFGRRPYETSDKSTNNWPLAILSMGESWHNLHHSYPSSARHGVGRWQIDSSAAAIRLFERAGWATKVRWPSTERLALLRA